MYVFIIVSTFASRTASNLSIRLHALTSRWISSDKRNYCCAVCACF